MSRYVATIASPLTAETAFEYMADVTNFAEWDPGVAAVRRVKRTGPEEGTIYAVAGLQRALGAMPVT